MQLKLTTTTLSLLVLTTASPLNRREEDPVKGDLSCFGKCEEGSTGHIVSLSQPLSNFLNLNQQCLWMCPSGTVCGKTRYDCPVYFPYPLLDPTTTADEIPPTVTIGDSVFTLVSPVATPPPE